MFIPLLLLKCHRTVTLDDSQLSFVGNVVGGAMGQFTVRIPGADGLIDAYLLVQNDQHVDQGSFNSTLKWSTESSWTKSGSIWFHGDISNLISDPVIKSEWKESLSYGGDNYETSTYLMIGNAEILDMSGNGQYQIVDGSSW